MTKDSDQVTAGFFQGLCTTEIGGVSFHEVGIEVVLAYQQAKLIAQPGLATYLSRLIRDNHSAATEPQEAWRQPKKTRVTQHSRGLSRKLSEERD